MDELHLFAGIGGGILAGELLGHRCIAAVEIDPFCRRVLKARQRDGCLPPFRIHDDIRTFDATPYRGVDLVAGGFPCQDISVAGTGAGLEGDRSGLWYEMLRVVRETRPRYVFVENVPALLVRGFDRVLGSLAELGFDAEWTVLSAADCGAPHLRRRLWLLAAHPERDVLRQQQQRAPRGRLDVPVGGQALTQHDGEERQLDSDADRRRREVERFAEPAGLEGARGSLVDGLRAARQQQHPEVANARGSRSPAPEQEVDRGTQAGRGEEGGAAAECSWWAAEPDVGRVAHGVPDRVGRLRGLGNAQVPVVAARAFRLLMDRF